MSTEIYCRFKINRQEPQFYIVTYEVLTVVNIRIDVLGAAVFFLSFSTAVIFTSILSHTILFHLFISTYEVKLVAGKIL